jgi:hypothetical protein
MPNPLNAPDVVSCREMGATAFWWKSLAYLPRVDKAVGSGFAGAGVIHSVLSLLYKFGCLRSLLITCELGVRFVMNIVVSSPSPGKTTSFGTLTSFLD